MTAVNVYRVVLLYSVLASVAAQANTLDNLRLFLTPAERDAASRADYVEAPESSPVRPREPATDLSADSVTDTPPDRTPRPRAGRAVVRGSQGVQYIVDGVPGKWLR